MENTNVNTNANVNANVNVNSKIKKVGTREEVFKGMALKTAGGLIKNDIIAKQFNNKILYISKKLSEKMRLNSNIPGIFKRQPKQTMRNIQNTSVNTNISTIDNVNPNTNTNPNPKLNKHSKTQKLSFKVCNNTVKTIYYPELQGLNIEELKNDLLKEENEEDNQNNDIHETPKEFTIQDMPDIDISNLN